MIKKNIPFKQNLSLVLAASGLTVILMAIASTVGLVYQETIYPTNELALAFLPTDIFNLVMGLPLILLCIWWVLRGRLIGLLLLPGALFYVLYLYVPYLLVVPFGPQFILYLALVPLSSVTIIYLIADTDTQAVKNQIADTVPARTAAGIMLGLAALVTVRQLAMIVQALVNQIDVDMLEIALWIDDFTLGVPALLIGGLLLWQKKAAGYFIGAGLLLQYGILSLGLVPFFILQPAYTGQPFDLAGLIVVLVMAAVCFVPLIYFIRGASTNA